MRLLVNEGNTPTVIFGPGDVRPPTAPTSSCSLAEVADCARVLAAWLVAELGVLRLRAAERRSPRHDDPQRDHDERRAEEPERGVAREREHDPRS